MKTGMNLLLWTGHVTEEHYPIMKGIKEAGFDGVEIPIFEGIARPLQEDAQGTRQPGPEVHDGHDRDTRRPTRSAPMPAIRQAAVDLLKRAID